MYRRRIRRTQAIRHRATPLQDGPYETHYENGQLHTRGTIRTQHDQYGNVFQSNDGLYEQYYKNGQLELRCSYKKGKVLGPYESYYGNGQLKEKCTYDKWYDDNDAYHTSRNGSYESYYENGQLKEKCTYERGWRVGPYESYYENGQPKEKSTYRVGYAEYGYCEEIFGPYEEYNEDGTLKQKGEYIDGKFIGGDELEKLVKKRRFKEKVEQLVSKKKSDKPRQGVVALLDSLNKQSATPERKAAKEAAVKTYRKAHPKSAERE